jgi:N12 class adenine-specific DNA methylase
MATTSTPTNSGTRPRKHECSQCKKPNAVGAARLCPTCKRKNIKASREKAHAREIERKYGVTQEQYDAVKEYQGGVCAICRVATGASKNLAVDHDHVTGEFRGLLCGTCNHRLLGAAHDGPEILLRALEYLANPPARQLFGRHDESEESA